jgi:hypothetical protein
MPINLETLPGGNFAESFLMRVESRDWPNDLQFTVWSPYDGTCYRICAEIVLESHFLRTGTGRLGPPGDGIPLANIYVTYGDAYRYWCERIQAFAEQGFDDGTDPICLEFESHLFAYRKHAPLRWDKDTGVLVVCRRVRVEIDRGYGGPMPSPHNIPAGE